MQNSISRLFLLGLGAMVGLVGCGSDGHDGSGTTKKVEPPAPLTDQGQDLASQKAYPAAPYGSVKGTIIPNFKFIGFANSVVTTDSLQPIELADFYNPTGTEVYGEGSVFGAGNPKPKALIIDVGSTWCPPCNDEAKTVLPGKYAKYKPLGGEFLLNLHDGPTPGKAAKVKDLYNWSTKYDVDYPGVIDPGFDLDKTFVDNAFPTNVLVKTSTMEIVAVVAGEPSSGFWSKFDKVLDGSL